MATKERKERSAAKPQPNSYHEGDEGHEVLNEPIWSFFLRALRDLRGEKVFSEMSDFELLHCKEKEF